MGRGPREAEGVESLPLTNMSLIKIRPPSLHKDELRTLLTDNFQIIGEHFSKTRFVWLQLNEVTVGRRCFFRSLSTSNE